MRHNNMFQCVHAHATAMYYIKALFDLRSLLVLINNHTRKYFSQVLLLHADSMTYGTTLHTAT